MKSDKSHGSCLDQYFLDENGEVNPRDFVEFRSSCAKEIVGLKPKEKRRYCRDRFISCIVSTTKKRKNGKMRLNTDCKVGPNREYSVCRDVLRIVYDISGRFLDNLAKLIK